MRRKYLWVMVATVMLMLSLSGCAEETLAKRELIFTTGLSLAENEIFKIGSLTATVEEAKLLLANVKNQYEEAFGEEIWNQEIQGQSFKAYAKEMVKNQLAQLKCMVLYAEKMEISLTAEEKDCLLQAAKLYYEDLSSEEQQVLAVSVEEIHLLYQHLALAEKVYADLTQDVDEEISDAEAKVIVVWHIFKAREDGKEEAIKEELMQLREQIVAEGVDFASLAKEYSEDEKLEYAFGRGELEQSFETAAFSLESGAVSGIVETSEGYHIIKCISDYDVEKTAQNKEELLKKRKQEAFDREYAQFTKDLTSEFHAEAWAKVVFDDLSVVDNKNLYQLYEECWQGEE